MTDIELPLLLEPEELRTQIGAEWLLLVDLSDHAVHAYYHIPGAVPLAYDDIVASQPPLMGLLPDSEHLSRVLSGIGLTDNHHVVAYDDGNNGKACRLLWTLDCLGHRRYSLLNGGLTAWSNTGLPLNNHAETANSSRYHARIEPQALADRAYIEQHLDDPSVVLLDTRSESEFNGTVVRARRGGHIPGAVNIEWTRAIDDHNDLRFRNADELRSLYELAGVTPDKQIITYCQTHHRSAHTYIVLKSLGYTDIKGYAGAWSEWGNLDDTPVE